MNKCEFKNVEYWYEPLDMLYSKESFRCEMSRDDIGFLCGIAKKIEPKKIVEIGVAEGGTTGVIVNALNMVGNSCDMYSVDLNEAFYADCNLITGYEFRDKLSKYVGNLCNHKFLLGKSIAGQVEDIGGDIDLAIIDTTHALPGEILDILAILPYMSENGIIVLHDVDLSRIRAIDENNPFHTGARYAVATKIALLSMTGEKYVNTELMGLQGKPLANIAAIKINDKTKENVYNLFYALTLPWSYHLSPNLIEEYRAIYKKHYDDTCILGFESAVAYSKAFDEVWE